MGLRDLGFRDLGFRAYYSVKDLGLQVVAGHPDFKVAPSYGLCSGAFAGPMLNARRGGGRLLQAGAFLIGTRKCGICDLAKGPYIGSTPSFAGGLL